MLNKLFRNNSIVVSLGKGFGCSFFPCSPAGVFLRTDIVEQGVAWWGCGNYGWNMYHSDNYSAFTDGNCGEYLVLTSSYQANAGHIFYDTGCCQVHYDGGTSYYIVDNCNPPCPPMGPTGATRTVNPSSFYWTGCGESGTFDYAGDIEDEYYDGSCGYFWQPNGTWSASDGTVIYQTGTNNCCTVVYTSYNNSYQVNDSCCADSGTLIRSETSDSTLDWNGCGNSGNWAYNTATTNFYADGFCGEYSAGSSVEQANGTVIFDNGCCTVYYTGSGSYSENDNCNPPPPDYPAAGTELNSGSSDLTSNISAQGNDIDGTFHSDFITVNIGTDNWTEYADGVGGSYFNSSISYVPEMSVLYTYQYGLVLDLSWAVTDGGGSYSGTQSYGVNAPTWIWADSTVQSGPTSFIDKLSEGYIIFETNQWWNGDANVKTRVEYQNGGGYITTTITF